MIANRLRNFSNILGEEVEIMSMKQAALDFMHRLQTACFEDKDFEFLLACLDSDIVWDGPGIHTKGYSDTKQMLQTARKTDLHRYRLVENNLEYVPLSDENFLIYGASIIQNNEDHFTGTALSLYITALCRQGTQGIKLCRFHLSCGGEAANQPELLSFSALMKNEWPCNPVNQKSAEVKERDRELKTLTDNIPGGIFRCLYDEPLTLLQMNNGFLSMFGYTRTQIRQRFHNSFLQMIDPRDREPVRKEARRQLALGATKELEYRVLCADGRSLWVLDQGQLMVSGSGQQSFCCIVVDITNIKKTQEDLRTSLERHRIVMDQTNDILFEWDLLNNRLSFSRNWEKKFGYSPAKDSLGSEIPSDENIIPEDRPAFLCLMRAVLNGTEYTQQELRIRQADGSALWCRVRITTQFDQGNQPIKAVGVIVDIDQEKKQSQKLLAKAERDALTKLYNKGATQNLIKGYLSACNTEEISALMIIDVDNFKQVNDSQGHLFGDTVLTQIATRIQKLFRTIDVIGRVGGDEFMVFLKEISGEQVAEQKAEQVIKAFQEIPDEQDQRHNPLSCSIGIALYPHHGRSFQELYHKADHALYQAKKQGKNQFVRYHNDMEETFSKTPGEITSKINGQFNSNEESKILNSKLMEYVLHMLYQSQDVEAAVNSLLEMVGRQFDVSRAYIYETTEDNGCCSNTFKWCNKGEFAEIDHFRLVSYDDLDENYRSNFNGDGIFYCRNVDELPPIQRELLKSQGVKSMLQCAIRDNGQCRGYVGFDECRINRFWTQEQVNALIFISEILSVFLSKERAQVRAEQTEKALLAVLDNQNSWIYVIHLETYEMVFINRKTKELVPSAQLGMRCYEAFFKRSAPCVQCPMRNIPEGGDSCTMEVYNPVLDVWSAADASLILWKDQKACLLTCRNITPDKKSGEL
ncbi:MAG: diguanylate cyclase [Clostridiales bacterium]|jgi:diguanylate cyclase (GGDEF)-like protein/PAS domain S-box-containing protein|nr:diguanylate cyclase [Clostridiales bacterium]